MSARLYMKRIKAVQGAMLRAQNPQFRKYWADVSEALLKKAAEQHG